MVNIQIGPERILSYIKNDPRHEKTGFYINENIGADQVRGYCTTDHSAFVSATYWSV